MIHARVVQVLNIKNVMASNVWILFNCYLVLHACYCLVYAADFAQLDAIIQQHDHTIDHVQRDRRATYKELCSKILTHILDQLTQQHVIPENPPLTVSLVGSLLNPHSYSVDIISHMNDPSLMVESLWGRHFLGALVPHISIQLPDTPMPYNFFFHYFDHNKLLPLMAHEIAHLWKFDALKRDSYERSLALYTLLCVWSMRFLCKTVNQIINNQPYSATTKEYVCTANTSMCIATFCGIVHAFLAQRGTFHQKQEFEADSYVAYVGIDALKNMISLLARWHIGVQLSQQHERAKRQISVAQWLWQLRSSIKTWFMKQYQKHPSPLLRITELLRLWQTVRVQELSNSSLSHQEAQQQAATEIAQLYQTMILQMPELTREYCIIACAHTLHWHVGAEEQEKYLIPTLEQIKQELLLCSKGAIHAF